MIDGGHGYRSEREKGGGAEEVQPGSLVCLQTGLASLFPRRAFELKISI